MHRILVEIETGGAERQIEVGNHHLVAQGRGDGEGDVVANGARPGTTLGADKGHDPAEGRRFGVGMDGGEAIDELRHAERRHDIVAHAAPQQLAIEQDVVDMADGDDLGGRIADLGEAIEIREHLVAVEERLDDEEARGWGFVEGHHRGLNPAHAHRHIGLGKTPVGRGVADHGGGVLVLAEGDNIDTRDRAVTRRLGPWLIRSRGLVLRREAHCGGSVACHSLPPYPRQVANDLTLILKVSRQS